VVALLLYVSALLMRLSLTLPLTSMLTLMLALYEPVTVTDVPPASYAAAPSPRFKELDPDDLA